MDPHQKIKEMCPFCEQKVKCSGGQAINLQGPRSAVAKKITWRRESEGLVLLSEKCPNCEDRF
jgi:hypothetical protein